MSKLEKFIDENRNDFDDNAPSAKVWENIEAAIITKKEKKKVVAMPFLKWSIAAGIILIIGTTVLLVNSNSRNVQPDIVIKEITVDSSIYQIAPDEAPQMSQFAKLIEVKQEELKELAKEEPQLYLKFTTDINQLDSSYNTLKTQLDATPNKEMLIEAMIQNLQLQLNVLNQQLNIINKIKNKKSNSHEKNDPFI